jgi:histidine triad (HIT) family protein
MSDCVFCRIVAGQAPCHPVYADEQTLAFLDVNPATRGHTLVVPRVHVTDLHEIGPAELAACTRTAQLVAARARDALGADGVNLFNACGVAAWQTVFHFHLHVVPRYPDDRLRRAWLPTPAGTDELSRTAAILAAA